MSEIVPITEVTVGQCKGFSCGQELLDEYLKRYAKGNHRKGVGKTFVVLLEQHVVGFYTLSMGNIEFNSVPKSYQVGLPKYPIPIGRIGRLAVDSRQKGRGLGKFLLTSALHKIWDASQIVAAYGVVVDAKNSEAVTFYQHFGFIPFENQSLSLFLPLASLRECF
ncbi:MAG TPA: GNAT family N-acetyltransferase [Chlamydiales bacterium]|nr:GNAT family N-acetyltransferase [Chlamydiales bacterium]